MKLRRPFSIAWAGWALAFVVIEGAALFSPAEGDTLSEHVWTFLDGGPARYALVGGFLVWLTWHMLGKGRHG